MAVIAPTIFLSLASSQKNTNNHSTSKTHHASLLKSCSNTRDSKPLYDNLAQKDSPKEVIQTYYHMVNQDILIDVRTYHLLMDACSSLSSIRQGSEVHSRILKSGLLSNRLVNNYLMGMYSKCGRIDEARKVFERSPERDVVSWNIMISCYVKSGLPEEGLDLFWRMEVESIMPDEVTMVIAVSACSRLRDLNMGKRLHLYIEKNDLEISGNLLNCLVDMYAKCGRIEEANALFASAAEADTVSWTTLLGGYVRCGKIEAARQFFDKMPERNVISWTTMIAGYVRNGFFNESLELFGQMRLDNVEPDEIALVTALSACAHVEDRKLGRSIHGLVEKNRMKLDGFLGNTLIDMYAKCRLLDSAHVVFQRLLRPNVVSYNAMLDGYCKRGDIVKARLFFDEMPDKDVVSWNTMIACYANFNRIKDVFELFREMQVANARPNKLTVISLLSACARTGALDHGKWIHVFIEKNNIKVDTVLGTALIDMYAKCGTVERAFEVFSDIHEENVCSWTAMIAAHSMQGQAKNAIDLYLDMERRGIKPDGITFIALLSACSHRGLVDEGYKYFYQMTSSYSIIPTVQHYGCMVDLLGRVGRLKEAVNFIRTMPVEPDISIWGSLMSACRNYHNVGLAEYASKHLLKLDPQNEIAYVLLSNIYAKAGRWEDAGRVRKKLKELGVRKQPGCSVIEQNGEVHEFTAGDYSHPRSREIYCMLDDMIRKLTLVGHTLNRSQVLDNVDEKGRHTLSHHSEKLAVAFGLISKSRSPIRVVNNLRICDDCHLMMKLISEAYKREIVIRDNYRFHCFRDGSCSCGDHW